eukprot:8111433-Pyramimonas_sp.AAC.1
MSGEQEGVHVLLGYGQRGPVHPGPELVHQLPGGEQHPGPRQQAVQAQRLRHPLHRSQLPREELLLQRQQPKRRQRPHA